MTLTATATHSMVYTESPLEVFGRCHYLIVEYGTEWPSSSLTPTFNMKFAGLSRWQLGDVLAVMDPWVWTIGCGRYRDLTVMFDGHRSTFSMKLDRMDAQQFNSIVKTVRSWSNIDETYRENRGK